MLAGDVQGGGPLPPTGQLGRPVLAADERRAGVALAQAAVQQLLGRTGRRTRHQPADRLVQKHARLGILVVGMWGRKRKG